MPHHQGNSSSARISNRSSADNTGTGGISRPAVAPVQRVLNYKGYNYLADSWVTMFNAWKSAEAGTQWGEITTSYNNIKALLPQIDAEKIIPAAIKAFAKEKEKSITTLETAAIGYSKGNEVKEDLEAIESDLKLKTKPYFDLSTAIKAQFTDASNLEVFENRFVQYGYSKKHWIIINKTEDLLKKNNQKNNLLNRFNPEVLVVFLSNDIDTQISFIDNLPPEEINKFLENSPDDQKKLVKGDEFQSYARLAGMERNFTRGDALKYNPTSSQGAHFVKEHGSHSTLHHTIERAVEYAVSKGQPNSTKGNWVSYKVENAAISWAKRMADANMNKAHHADTTPKSKKVLDEIVATPANIFEEVEPNVNEVIANNYAHGEISNSGNSQLTIKGDYRDDAGAVVNDDITGTVRGNVTGTQNGNLNSENVEITSVYGNGLSTLDTFNFNAQTLAANKIGGRMKGAFTFNNAQITAKVGNNYIDGMGNITARASNTINSANTNYNVNVGGDIEGTLGDQKMNDGAKNSIAAGNLKVNGPNGAVNSIVNLLNAPYSWYKNGLNKRMVNGTKIKNLKGDLIHPDKANGGFTPGSLGHIIQVPKITARTSSYKKVDDNTIKQMQLLAASIKVEGTLTDLKTAGLVENIITTLADLKLDVANVVKVAASGLPDVKTTPNPIAGTRYKCTFGVGKIYEFDLQSITNPIVTTDFRVLLMLKDGGMYPTYEPFTAY